MTSDTEEWLDNTALLIEEDGHVLDDFNHTGDVMGEYNEVIHYLILNRVFS